MDPDEELCLCFHVSRRKVLSFLRTERPVVASQLSQCQGAGTGCGWCRPFLRALFERARKVPGASRLELPDAVDYARLRAQYLRDGRGTPPPEAPPPSPPQRTL